MLLFFFYYEHLIIVLSYAKLKVSQHSTCFHVYFFVIYLEVGPQRFFLDGNSTCTSTRLGQH